ncbi:MAG: metalloregulator ArsR/SmtB family transcription factor [Desulfobacteraceae bacterium]|nr:metalloregulator ArsR/SmtB family transcription factor [Desulfobacteraceae bacterium]
MKKFTKVMKALSDPSRVKILKMLQRKQMCVCEIQNALGIAQSTASKHLKILEEAGLTTYKKDGLWVNYTLADGSDSPYAAAMLGTIRHWLEDEEEIADLSKQIFDIRREDICRAKDRQNQRNKP